MRSTPEVSFLLVIHISLYSHNSGISRNHLTKCSDQRKVYLVRIYHWKIFCIFFLLVILLQHHELINSPVPELTAALNYFAPRKIKIIFSVSCLDLRAEQLLEVFLLL